MRTQRSLKPGQCRPAPGCWFMAAVLGMLAGCAGKDTGMMASYHPDPQHGMALYASGCGTCHDRGREGAPALGDPEEWDMQSLQQAGVVRQRHDQQWLAGQPLSGHDEADALAWIRQTLAERNPDY